MMRLSHRDQRASRDIARSAWGMLGLVLVLGARALWAPIEAIRVAAVRGLAAAGGVYLWESSRTVDTYVADLDRVHRDASGSGRLRAEVASDGDRDARVRRHARTVPPPRRQAGPPAPPEG